MPFWDNPAFQANDNIGAASPNPPLAIHPHRELRRSELRRCELRIFKLFLINAFTTIKIAESIEKLPRRS